MLFLEEGRLGFRWEERGARDPEIAGTLLHGLAGTANTADTADTADSADATHTISSTFALHTYLLLMSRDHSRAQKCINEFAQYKKI